jgi:hypothetical protein
LAARAFVYICSFPAFCSKSSHSLTKLTLFFQQWMLTQNGNFTHFYSSFIYTKQKVILLLLGVYSRNN